MELLYNNRFVNVCFPRDRDYSSPSEYKAFHILVITNRLGRPLKINCGDVMFFAKYDLAFRKVERLASSLWQSEISYEGYLNCKIVFLTPPSWNMMKSYKLHPLREISGVILHLGPELAGVLISRGIKKFLRMK